MTEDDHYVSNHVLFIDDLKLFAEKEKNLNSMTEKTEFFFKLVVLKSTRQKQLLPQLM